MTREEAINEINKVFTSAYANYIVTALTEGATVSDIQRRWWRAYEAGVKDGLEQEPKWIPVTERLPDKDGLYLVSVKNDHERRYSKTCWYSEKNWFARQDVVAWMPGCHYPNHMKKDRKMTKRELIERERLINELTESSKHHAQTSREESLLCRDRQIVREQPTITEQDIVKPVLDKIRAEIMKLDDINPDYPMDRTIHISRNEVLQIINKYKTESEG